MKKQILLFSLTSFASIASCAMLGYSFYELSQYFSHVSPDYQANLLLTMFFYLILFALFTVITIMQGISIKKEYTKTSEARKSERTAAKQAKAEADKQKEIAELQAKLDELKKDE